MEFARKLRRQALSARASQNPPRRHNQQALPAARQGRRATTRTRCFRLRKLDSTRTCIAFSSRFVYIYTTMKCDICKTNEAVIFFQQMNSAAKNEFHLCMECAGERGIYANGDTLELSFPNIIAELASTFSAVHRELERTCPVCGKSTQQTLKAQRLGCPECYTHFASELRDIQNGFVSFAPYTGSLPRRLRHADIDAEHSTKNDLQKRLEEAVQNEDYEMAAFYRDKINENRKEITQ
ncbi:MAG: hypothetical protein Ta2A_20660 [Treponemataceae bacterium]|nr:MAG: hypothetical protein Ta2A_20660 [Treponemataceae bacterium]